MFLEFHSDTHGLLDELDIVMLRGVGVKCPNCEAYKESVEKFFSECASYNSQRQTF